MKVAVIGGGPAGVMAAIAAAKEGAEVVLLERNDKLLRKLRISGKGRCNLTNAMDTEHFLSNVLRNPRFVRSAFSGFDNRALMDFVEGCGVRLKVERGQRVFPASDDAHEIADALVKQLQQLGVEIRFNARVKGVEMADGAVSAVNMGGGKRVDCDACVLATGGISYPRTGSTGDGHKFAARLGHGVTDLLPSLAPISTAEPWVGKLQGLSLRNVELHAFTGNKKVFSERGELLFTDSGISGPLALSASAHMEHSKLDESRVVIDLKPALTEKQLDARLLRDFGANSNRMLHNSLGELLPKSMIPVAIDISGIDGDKPCHSITKEERQRLLGSLKRMELHPVGIGPIDVAIVTRGGVEVGDVNPKTMGSKLVHRLYFAGELLDIDAYTGGFNLQLAFSTGYTAGKNCAIIRESAGHNEREGNMSNLNKHNGLVIAIDGPSAAGKSTVARQVSKRLGIHRLDTGALFRALAWQALASGADLDSSEEVMRAIDGCALDIDIDGAEQKTLVDGKDVTKLIRSEEVSRGAAALGIIPEVRQLLTERVREIAGRQAIVVDGRDIGTAMLPDADIKIFLVADASERARRRYEELPAGAGRASYEEILAGIIERDKTDAGRSIAPLKKAEDAIEIDSTLLTIEEVVGRIVGKAESIYHG